MVHGGAGDVGVAAVQLGRALGLQTIAATNDDSKRDFALRAEHSLRSLAPEGRLLVLGSPQASIPTVRVNRLLLGNTAGRASRPTRSSSSSPGTSTNSETSFCGCHRRTTQTPVDRYSFPTLAAPSAQSLTVGREVRSS